MCEAVWVYVLCISLNRRRAKSWSLGPNGPQLEKCDASTSRHVCATPRRLAVPSVYQVSVRREAYHKGELRFDLRPWNGNRSYCGRIHEGYEALLNPNNADETATLAWPLKWRRACSMDKGSGHRRLQIRAQHGKDRLRAAYRGGASILIGGGEQPGLWACTRAAISTCSPGAHRTLRGSRAFRTGVVARISKSRAPVRRQLPVSCAALGACDERRYRAFQLR